MRSAVPRVSVVVVAHNEGDNLRPTLNGLLADLPGHAEMVVVDDHSSDGSTAFLEDGYGGVRLQRPPGRLGISGARNFGGRMTSGDVLVFSDAHVEPGRNWLAPLCRALERSEVGEVAPAISVMGNTDQKGYGFTWRDARLQMSWLGWRANQPYPVPMLCGCFVAMRRDVFEASGGFDEGLQTWGSEDAELSLRLWRMGYECLVVPESDVAHLFRRRFPYAVDWAGTIHNVLRMAAVHLPTDTLAKVVAHYAKQVAFPKAYAGLVQGDTWERREAVARICRRDGTWFVDRFGLRELL
jgi:GT2 family glycosyltransferase